MEINKKERKEVGKNEKESNICGVSYHITQLCSETQMKQQRGGLRKPERETQEVIFHALCERSGQFISSSFLSLVLVRMWSMRC